MLPSNTTVAGKERNLSRFFQFDRSKQVVLKNSVKCNRIMATIQSRPTCFEFDL